MAGPLGRMGVRETRIVARVDGVLMGRVLEQSQQAVMIQCICCKRLRCKRGFCRHGSRAGQLLFSATRQLYHRGPDVARGVGARRDIRRAARR